MRIQAYPGSLSRRTFLAQVIAATTMPALIGCGNTPIGYVEAETSSVNLPDKKMIDTEPTKDMEQNGKTIVIYFSHSGNTRVVANNIHALVGGDMVELKTVEAYPENYDRCVDQARKELDSNFRPKLKTTFENIDDYSMIYLGYPNWWGTTPMAVATMLENHDFSGKTIIPFCTHEGSGLGQSNRDIAKWSPKSTLETGLAIRGRSVSSSKPDVEQWLRQLGKIKG